MKRNGKVRHSWLHPSILEHLFLLDSKHLLVHLLSTQVAKLIISVTFFILFVLTFNQQITKILADIDQKWHALLFRQYLSFHCLSSGVHSSSYEFFKSTLIAVSGPSDLLSIPAIRAACP